MSRMNERPRHLGRASTSLAECTLSEPEETPRYRIVEEDGTYDPDRVPELSDEAFVDLYRWMVLQQVVDNRMVKLHRHGSFSLNR